MSIRNKINLFHYKNSVTDVIIKLVMGTFLFTIIISLLGASNFSLNLKDGDKAVLIDKDKALLKVIQRNGNEYKELFEIFISYGQKEGAKAKEGDFKTPEGVYFAKNILSKYDLKNFPDNETYGSYALILNYPNPIDEKNKNTGYGIWIHGTDSKDKLSGKNVSKGCIIMQNKDINKLIKHVRIMQTPIIILSSFEDLKFETTSSEQTLIKAKNYNVKLQELEKKSKVLYEDTK